MRFFAFALFFCFSCPVFAGSVNDQLFKVDADYDYIRDYIRLRDKKLASSPFDCGRVIVQPATAPEYSVSVYSQKVERTTEYKITFVKCDNSLWQTTEMGHHPNAANSIMTQRKDEIIPAATGKLLRKVWIQLLSGRHTPRPVTDNDLTTTDGTEAEFSISVRNNVLRGVVLDVTNVRPDGIIGNLVEISKELVAYCRVNPNERDGIARRIDERAQALLQRL